jgi:hypothetical protein
MEDNSVRMKISGREDSGGKRIDYYLRSNWEKEVRAEVSKEDASKEIVRLKVGVRRSTEQGTNKKKKRVEQEALNDVTVANPIRMVGGKDECVMRGSYGGVSPQVLRPPVVLLHGPRIVRV